MALPKNIIIPNKTLNTDYLRVLNSIDRLITTSERKMLLLLNRYCKNDGRIFPKRKTLAQNMSLSTRQISNILRSLVNKGFLYIDPPESLNDRHCYGKCNNYHFLYHEAYKRFVDDANNVVFFCPTISSENSGKISRDLQNHTTYNNKSLKDIKHKRHDKHVIEYTPKRNKVSEYAFNVTKFREENKEKHPVAVDLAVKTVVDRMKKGEYTQFPKAYGQKIVNVQSGNMFEAQTIEEHRSNESDKEVIHANKRVLNDVGYKHTHKLRNVCKSRINTHIEENDKKSLFEKQQDLNSLRNELFRRFG